MNKQSVTQATYNKVAQQYWEKVASLDQYITSYDTFCKLLPQKANVLEIGCGPGNVTKYMLHKRPDPSYTASDLAPNMLALANKLNSKAFFFSWTAAKLLRSIKNSMLLLALLYSPI